MAEEELRVMAEVSGLDQMAARVLPGNRAMMKQALLEEVLMIIFSELGLMPLAEKTDCREWID